MPEHPHRQLARRTGGTAGRRAGGDQIAGLQVVQRGHLGKRLVRLENHVAAIGVLAGLPVDMQLHAERGPAPPFLLVQQHQERPDRAEAAVALALVELGLRQLDVARRNVVDDGHASEVLVQLVRPDLDRLAQRLAHHETKLDFVVEQMHMRRPHHVGVGGRKAGRGLGEQGVEADLVRVHAGLTHMAGVVDALAQELAVRRDRRQQRDGVERQRGLAGGAAPRGFEAVRDEVGGAGRAARQGRDAAVVDHTPAGFAAVEISDDFDGHLLSLT